MLVGKCSSRLQGRGTFRNAVRLWILQNLEGKILKEQNSMCLNRAAGSPGEWNCMVLEESS